MEQVVKLGWWASKSKGAKAGIIFGSAAAVAVLSWAVWQLGFKDKSELKKDTSVTPKTDSETTSDTNTKSELKEKPHIQVDALTLPNKGVGCSEVITTFDRDFDYVKCGEIWYYNNKVNPSKDWISLETNEVKKKLLQTRYPNL